MSSIAERVFSEVCLDERVSDGIFRMDNEEHMNALRDYFVKKGITKEAAIHVTNRMVEGKYPDRQAWRVEDGILVTWPSPQHKAKAMREEPKKYTEKDPNPKPKAEKPQEPEKKEPPVDKEPALDKEKPESQPPSNPSGETMFTGTKDDPALSTGNGLQVEPLRGEKPEPIPQPSTQDVPVAPRTPERVAAEKEVVNQILATDDSALTNVANPLNVKETALTHQLNELYKKADAWGFREAVTFLTPYVKP